MALILMIAFTELAVFPVTYRRSTNRCGADPLGKSADIAGIEFGSEDSAEPRNMGSGTLTATSFWNRDHQHRTQRSVEFILCQRPDIETHQNPFAVRQVP